MADQMKDRMNDHAAFAMDDALEGARRATGNASSIAAPNPEVAAIARRRQFPIAEKLRILAAADQCLEPGEIVTRTTVVSPAIDRFRGKPYLSGQF